MTITVTAPDQPDTELLKLGLELAALERPRWPERLTALHRSGVPLLAGDDDGGDSGDRDGGGSGGSGRDGDDDTGDNDDDRDGDRGGSSDDDTDDDDGDSDLERARRAAAKYRRERDELKRSQSDNERKALEKAGKFEELYKKEKQRADELEAEKGTRIREDLGRAALGKLNVKSSSLTRALRLMDTDELEDDDDAERAARALKREFPELFDTRSRSKRGGGRNDDDDSRDDDRDDRRRRSSSDDDSDRRKRRPGLTGASYGNGKRR